MQSEGRKKNRNHGLCELCRYEDSILGRKLCPVCLQAMARLAFATGVRASPILTGLGAGSGELPEKEDNVRTHIGGYAYEVRKEELCAEGRTSAQWAFMVYKVAATEELIAHGEESLSQEHAERNARQLIALHIELDRQKSNERSNARM